MNYHQYAALLNKPYIEGFQDCYSLVRDFHDLIYGITLPDYARPAGYSSPEFNLLTRLSSDPEWQHKAVIRSKLLVGDVISFRVAGDTVNHLGVYVGNNLFIHHLFNSKSKEDNLDQRWFRRIDKISRHVDALQVSSVLDMSNLIAPSFLLGAENV
jgi:cell wall-associated NlpC family hydrolase